jgi:crotonobetainyl-CoA:carnitine CoA-transferase CaiB-like acyl-CoA transferase
MPTFRVADFSTHYPGPMTSHLLSELGADVVKFENPRFGDGNRSLPPFVDGVSVFHAMLSSDTRSAAVDRRSPEWPDIFRAAARWADVVVVSGPSVELAARGLDFQSFARENSRIVYCSLSAYGNVGPWRNLPGHGQNMDAYAGAVSVETDELGLPATPASWRGPGTSVSPIFAALGIMRALFERDQRNEPQCVEVSVWGAALWFSWRDIVCQANLGQPWQGVRDLGSRYAMYRASDGLVILACPIERKFWESFCDVVGLPDDLKQRGTWENGGMDFGKGDAYDGERQAIQNRIETRRRDEWVWALGEAGVPIAPILDLAEVLESDHAAAEGVLITLAPDRPDSPALKVPRNPIRLDGEDPRTRTTPPRLGQHTEEVLRELGLS